MKILVLNCGSSSIKYQLLDMPNKQPLAQGIVDKIGLPDSLLKITLPNDEKVSFPHEIKEHKRGIQLILDIITDKQYGVIGSLAEIEAVGHRVVHGGEKFNKSTPINDEVIQKIVECIDLAPLHNPPNLAGIQTIKDLMPALPQVAVFDTAFHQTMPDYAYMYGLPYSLYEKRAVRRYGFHGTSHRYVSARACEFLGVPYEKQRIISCHLGGGSSVTAIQNGRSVDTSMGMTPVEGLIMGTRCGDVDAGVLTYLMEKEHWGAREISKLINKDGGVKGVSEISSDMRDICKAIGEGDKKAALAMQMFEYQLKKYIGAYTAALGGADILIFTGGIGENQTETRQAVCKGLAYLGIQIDEQANLVRGEEIVISTPNSTVKVVVIPTNEEYMIALDTMQAVTK